MTGIGSNSSSVPASALACWGSKSEIRRDESAGDKRKVLGCWGEKIRKKKCLFLNTFLNIITILIELAVSEKNKHWKHSSGAKPVWYYEQRSVAIRVMLLVVRL